MASASGNPAADSSPLSAAGAPVATLVLDAILEDALQWQARQLFRELKILGEFRERVGVPMWSEPAVVHGVGPEDLLQARRAALEQP
eukprot:CAMPEP_0183469392 /NCGR_PEP_ID=MMETSP0370-20130417/154409_1 /TAXON_ID=268820 /ORGANISM="Peridinium aciculiferum, Strain PAER-2" /LENGTH=86 /DNA_ID=CAMNT_0025661841 /DNA_START=59 /DNA_END=314 /DNA_ORIENTATION=+